MSSAYVMFGLTTNSGISNGFELYPDRGDTYGSTYSQSYVNRLLVYGDPLYSGPDLSVTTKCNGVVQYQGVIPASLLKTPGINVISDSIGVIYNPTGAISPSFFEILLSAVAPDCSGDSDCADCEKCDDGECVPCDKCVDGKGLVTLWGVKTSDGTVMSDALPVYIASGVEWVQLSNFDSSFLTAGRIQIFNGMSGTLTVKAGIGILGSDFGASIVTGKQYKQIGRAHV